MVRCGGPDGAVVPGPGAFAAASALPRQAFPDAPTCEKRSSLLLRRSLNWCTRSQTPADRAGLPKADTSRPRGGGRPECTRFPQYSRTCECKYRGEKGGVPEMVL